MRNLRSLRLNAAFTLLELLIVVAILAILAGLAITFGGGSNLEAKRQFALETLIETKEALLRFRNDMGSFPGENEFAPNEINVRNSLSNSNARSVQDRIGALGNTNQYSDETNHKIWSQALVDGSSIFNFWMLFERPQPQTGDANEYVYNKDTRRGWYGPYLRDDRNIGYYPDSSNYGNYYAIADVFDDQPEAQNWFIPAYRSDSGADEQETLGVPIRFSREGSRYFLTSAGPNGEFEALNATDSDDIRLLVAEQ